jgi:hypothetical protein
MGLLSELHLVHSSRRRASSAGAPRDRVAFYDHE